MRKNPWIKRKAKELYKKINNQVESDSEYIEKTRILEEKANEADLLIEEISFLNEEFVSISEKLKSKSPDLLMEALPIESTKDLYEIERDGKTSKPNYSDISNLVKKAKELDKISDKVEKAEEEEKILKIEQLILKINKILEINN